MIGCLEIYHIGPAAEAKIIQQPEHNLKLKSIPISAPLDCHPTSIPKYGAISPTIRNDKLKLGLKQIMGLVLFLQAHASNSISAYSAYLYKRTVKPMAASNLIFDGVFNYSVYI